MKYNELPYIPKIYLRTSSIAKKAETMQGYAIDSEVLPSGTYIARGDDFLIVTRSNGYLRLKRDDVPALIEELQGILKYSRIPKEA